MNNRILILFVLIYSNFLSQSFYFKRINQLDTCQLTSGFDYEGKINEFKTIDNHLIIDYGLTFCNNFEPYFRYIKIDTSGNILWQKTGSSYLNKTLKYGHILGLNFNQYNSVSSDVAYCYYDQNMDLKWGKAYFPDQNYYLTYHSGFNYIDTLNSKNYFRYYYYCPGVLKDSSQLYIAGNLDSLGNISNIKNEPALYDSDSMGTNLHAYLHKTNYIGVYSGKHYFVNSGNKYTSGGWFGWTNKREYSYVYISAYDSVANKYEYHDIKIDSLWAINGCVRFSNDRVWIFGSRQFQPYVFCMSLDGQVHWAKKIHMPELADGAYGAHAFTKVVVLDQNNILIGRGPHNSDTYTYSYLIVDSLFQIKEELDGYYLPNISMANINGAYYHVYSNCGKLGVIKTKTFKDVPCWSNSNNSFDIRAAKKPKLNYVEHSPLSVVSLTITNYSNNTYPLIHDSLVKYNGCVPYCYVPPAQPPVIPSATVFPNPTNNYITVNVNAPYDFKLFSSDGKKLMDQKYVKFQKIDLSTYPNGVYFLILYSGSEIYKEKIIKKE